MSCPACRQRKARRHCPALRETICSVCCGTKRLREINCPEDCPHLASAREHPAAVVRRQQQEDVAALLPSISHLTERQYQLFFLFQTAIARHQPDGLTRLLDADVADATASLAATLETADRGVLYDHTAQTLPAQRLGGELKAMLSEIRKEGARVSEREAAVVLRAIEQGCRDARKTGGGETAYLNLIARLLQVNRAVRQPGVVAPPAPAIIIP